ncbi:MAG: serine/threonine-protein kinase, partial [Fimbriiglobus sp.]
MNPSPRDPNTPPYVPLSAAAPSPPAASATERHPFPFLAPARDAGELGWLGHYRVVRLLGAGGMGYVFEAEDPGLRRAVALKVMKPELANDYAFRERFLGEARAAAKLVSDYVVTVFQVGTAEDVPYLAMQLLYGESLQDKLERSGPLQVAQAVLVAKQTAEGLAAAHEVGLVHRDIKPANLWLESEKPGGSFKRVRILDFGLARAFDQDQRLTATGVIVGTPHYMAPEQASGHKVDGRADVFSLGCVIYATLTGEMPFDGPTTMSVLMALANHVPPPLTEKRRDCPPDLADLVARMMNKAVADRARSATEVAAELDAILDEMPTGPASFKISGGIGMAALQRRGATPSQGSRITPGPRPSAGGGGIVSGVRGPMGHAAETPSM